MLADATSALDIWLYSRLCREIDSPTNSHFYTFSAISFFQSRIVYFFNRFFINDFRYQPH